MGDIPPLFVSSVPLLIGTAAAEGLEISPILGLLPFAVLESRCQNLENFEYSKFKNSDRARVYGAFQHYVMLSAGVHAVKLLPPRCSTIFWWTPVGWVPHHAVATFMKRRYRLYLGR